MSRTGHCSTFAQRSGLNSGWRGSSRSSHERASPYAGTRSGYGKTVEIDHGFGYKTRYAHAGSIQVKRGQRVDRGDILGEVGKTGLATAPHLHYEVLIEGRHVNPRQYLLDDIVYE